MPKNKFDAFYYGVGMKLDEASVDQAGKQLEGRLNQVVDRVKDNLMSISDAANKGVKNIDTKGLVGALVEAQRELGRFDDFDPKQLKGQIDGLESDFKSLKSTLGDVADSLKGFKDLGGFITDISTRLGNIEIRTSKQGKDALKADLKEMKTLAQGFSQILANGEQIDTSALDKYLKKVKAGFASLKASGNPMELFADKELANYFVDITNVLRKMGAPVEDLRADFFELSSTFKGFFAQSSASGAQTIFKDIGYQIESVSTQLHKAKAELADYEAQIAKMESRTRTTGFAITIDDDKNLNFEQKIKRIEEYGDIVAELDYGDEWAAATRNQIALIQAAEKELGVALKTNTGKDMLSKWQQAFGKYDLTDRLSTSFISDYVNLAQQELDRLKGVHTQTQESIRKFQEDIGRLQATEKAATSKNTKQTSKSTTQKQKAEGVVANVEAKIKINETEWAKTINAALANLESKNKIKPVKIPVTTTQGTTLKKIQEQTQKIRDMALVNPKDEGASDIKSFNHKFDKFLGNLKERKTEIADFLTNEWKPALRDAFSFRMEILGIDNKSVTKNISEYMLPTVDAINMVLENKPIIFHSNIDALVEEVKSKLQDIKIDIGTGNVNVNPQGLSNANIIIQGIVGGGGGTPPVNPLPTAPSSAPSQPSAPTSKSTKTTSNKDVDKQAIYNNVSKKIKDLMDGFTNPKEALEEVKKQAQILYQRLQDAGEGTQDYYEAQIELTTLLSKWRGKIGSKNAAEGFKTKGLLGSRYAEANWQKYLTDNGIIPDSKNKRFVSSVSKLEEMYGLKKPSDKSYSTTTSKKTKANTAVTAEEQMANELEAGKRIIENYIKLAKWARALNTIAEGADIEIKESDFKDTDTISRRGNFYTKEDIGTVIKGRKIEFEELDAFIAEYEQSENEEDRRLFGFLKNLIDAYKGNQQRLDSLLNELSDSDVVGRYEFADNKTEQLATDLKSSYKTIMGKKGSQKAQKHLTDVFGKYNIDLSALPSAKTYAEQWQIIEQQIIGRKGLDFEGLMSELGSLKGNVGKTYENFMTLLKVSRAYMLASNSLGEVGKEAAILMRGKKEKADKEIREYDPSTGRTRGTGEYIEGGRNKLVVEGLRQEISKLAVVFIDKLGNAIAGFGAGKGIVNNEDYLNGSSASYSKIVRFLTESLEQAATIAFDLNRRTMSGYQGVTQWNPEQYINPTEHRDNYQFTTATTEKKTIETEIQKVEKTKKNYEQQLGVLDQKLNNAISSVAEVQKITELSSKISQKNAELQTHKNKIVEVSDNINKLRDSLVNPEVVYEDIVSNLLQEEKELLSLRKQLEVELQKNPNSLNAGVINENIKTKRTHIGMLKRHADMANRDFSDEKGNILLQQEENQIALLKEEHKKMTEDLLYKNTQEEINRLIKEKDPLLKRINQLRNEIQKTDKDAKSSDINAKKQELDELLEKTKSYQSQIEILKKQLLPHKTEMDFISKEIMLREKYVKNIKNALSHKERVQTSEENKGNIEVKEQELTQLQQEQEKIQSELTSLREQEQHIVDKEIKSLQQRKSIAEKRLKELNAEINKGDSKNLTQLQAEKTNLEKEIMSLNKEVEAWNSRSIIATISLMQQEATDLQERIAKLNNQLSGYQQGLKTVDGKTKKYSKSYEGAVADLPRAKAGKERAQSDLLGYRMAYSTEQAAFIADAIAKQKSGVITQEELTSIVKMIPKIDELNQKFINGKISYQDYLKTVENAYITMRNATTDEAKVSAQADAKRLADATDLVRKYQEELKMLDEIIRTQKPKEPATTQSSSQSSNKTQTQTSKPQAAPTQPAGGETQVTGGGVYSTTGGQGVVLNLGGSGLATEGTVKAIYDLLSVKKNGDVDSKIEEIKKAIAAKEEEKRIKEEGRKTQEESKKAQETKKAEEEAARKAETAKKKAEEETAKAKAEAERKKAETEAAQKRAKETTEKNKPEAKATQQKAETKSTNKEKTPENKQGSDNKVSKDVLLDVLGKSSNEFWKAYRATMQEIQAGQRVFREHSIKLNKGSVTGVVRGLTARAPGLPANNLDTYGHLHPRDSLYSAQDFEGMKIRRQWNTNYNTDFLLTPNYIYKLDELKNASIEALEAVQKQFKEVESAKITGKLATTVKESYLHNFAQQNGVQLNKMSVNSDGTTSDITQQIEVFGKDVLDKIIELGKLNQQIISSFKNKQSNTDEHKNLVGRRDALVQELLTNELYKKVAPKDFAENTKSALFHNNKTYKSVDSTLIQEAVDFDFDLSLFVDTIKDFFVQMQKLGEVVPANSPLEKIKTYIDNISKLPVDSSERKNLIEQMKPYIYDVFKKNVTPLLDTRDDMLNPLKDIAKLDSSGQINKVIQKFAPKDSGDNSEINLVKMTTEELKAELTRLEALRDSGEVDPRFATAEKQDVIINLLKSGIKVSGKVDDKSNSTSDGSTEATKKPRVPQMPNVAKAAIQAEEIGKLTNVNKDSSLYRQYIEAKEMLDEAISSATAKGKDRTKDDTDQIRALLSTVTSLGKQILETSKAFDYFQSRGGKSFDEVITDVDALKQKMYELAATNASESHQLIRDISYDDVSQKMTYNLVDLEGNITRVTMAYNELLGSVLTTSEKMKTSASKIYGVIEGEMTNRIGVNDIVSQTPELGQSIQYQAYIDAYNAMMDAQDALRVKGEMATKEEKANLVSLTNQVANTRGEFEKLAKASAEFKSKVEGGTVGFALDGDLNTQMKNFVLNSRDWTKSQKEMIENTWVFKNAQDGATYSVVQGKNQLASMSVVADQGSRQIGQYTVETKKYISGFNKFMTSMGAKWKEVLRYLMSFGSLYRVWAVLRKGIQYIREIDSALTELKKVTNETEETYDKFLDTAAKTASKVGSTAKEIVSSTADWARLGYSMEEAAKLAESTSVLLNVSEFQSIDEATSALTSTMQAFGYTADESMNVVDVLNEVGNNFAISSDGIATALQDSASSLMAANNSYQEAVALIAAANRVVQDPNSVGAALRTISLRLRGTSVKELEEAGEDTTGVVTSKSKLRSKVKSLSGVDILTNTGAYKSTYEILLDISKVWENISDIDQAALLEIIAGKTRSNTAAAILSNTEDLEDAFEAANSAAGSAFQENEKYLDSVQGRIDILNNTIQSMWQSVVGSDAVKFIVNFGTELLKIVDTLGVVKTLFITIGAFAIKKYWNGDLFGGITGVESSTTKKDMKLRVESLRTEYGKAQNAWDNNHTKDNQKYLNKTRKEYENYNKNYNLYASDYIEAEKSLESLQNKRQSLVKDIENSQSHEDFLGKRLSAGYDVSAESIDKAQKNTKKLQVQLQDVDKEIINTQNTLQNLGNESVRTGNSVGHMFTKMKTGLKKAGASLKKFGKEMLASIATMYAFSAIFDIIGKIGEGIYNYFDKKHETTEEIQEKFQELNSELDNTKSKLRNLESELNSTNDKIDELLSQDTLTLVEQEELNNLRATSDELERQIELEKALQKQQQQAVNNQAFKAMRSYADNTSFYSEKSQTERQGEAKEIGSTIGNVAGLIIGGAIGSYFGGNTVVGAGIGSAVLSPLGGFFGSMFEEGSYMSELSVREAMDQMSTIRAGLQADVDQARDSIKNATTATEEQKETLYAAEQSLANFDAALGESINQVNQYLNSIDYSLLTDPNQQQEYLDNLRYSLKYNIEYGMPGAKTTAASTIFDDKYITDELQNVKDQIQAKLALNNNIDFGDIDVSDEAQKQLDATGLTLTDVIATFKELKKEEDDALLVDSSDMVSSIANLTDGIQSLKQAFDEFNESGIVTAKTLKQLNETFNHLDGWQNYINVMSSGIASTKEAAEATNELAEDYLMNIMSQPFTFVDDPTTEINEATEGYNAYFTAISQLQNLGVTNSKDLVDAMQQKAVAKIVSDEIKLYNELNKKKKEGTITTAEEEQLAKLGNKTTEERIKSAEEKYGVELKNTDLIEDQVSLLETQEDLEKYKTYRSKFNDGESDLLNQYNSSIETYSNLANTYNGLLDSLNELHNQGYGTSDVTATEFKDAGKMAVKFVFSGEILNADYSDGLYNAIEGSAAAKGTGYGDRNDLSNQMDDVYEKMEDEIDKRKKLFEEMIEIAEEEGISLDGIDVDNFDPMVYNDGSVFNQVYNKVKPAIEAKAAELEAMEKELKDKLDTAFDEIGLEVTLELMDKNKLIDDIQSVYDSLKNAQKEYAENGYLSVDTIQALLGLEPKYLALLYDENGQLNLNEEALLRVAEARIIDMGIAQQKAILEQGLALATKGSRDALLEYVTAIEDATEANGDFVESQLAAIKAQLQSRTIARTETKTIKTWGGTKEISVVVDPDLSVEEADKIYNSIKDQVDAVQYTVDLGIKGLPQGGLSNTNNSEESALEKLQKKYEHKISNLNNQQTYLENEIKRLEAENKGVSKSYYEDQIEIEEQKMSLLQQQRTELTSLLNSTKKGTDDWWEIANALWEVEHSIQESTLRTIEFRESIAELYKTAFDELDQAYGNKEDLYSDRQAYIEKYMELLELQGKAKPASGYMGLIAEEEAKLANSMAELNGLRQVLANGIADGSIKEGDDRWVEMQSSIRETEAAILDSKVAIEKYKEELKSLQVEAFDMVRTAFSNRNDYYTNQQDYIEGYIDYLEATGVDATPEIYEKLIAIEKEKRANNVADLVDARAGLAKLEAAGYTAADEEWVDANNRIVELEKGIQDSDIAMAQWQKTIREMDFEKFDQFAERVNSLNEELENVYQLVEDEDVAFDDGTWTKEGITALSMLYHQIENNKKMIDEYNEELAKLEKQYKSGEISEKEYLERADDLQDRQWELVHTNEDLKDSIIDINEARIDLVEEGINKEIDAYEELIELKKEELDAERDLYEFRKDVEKQTKDISELERKIAALSGSDDDADIAERRKLEAQLREAKDGLNDTYYSHSKDSQSQALDDELDAYQKSAEDYIETLREQLENTEAMIKQTFSDVLLNADVTYQELLIISDTYGPTLSTNLMQPWYDMGNEATRVKAQIGEDLLSLNEDNIAPFSENAQLLLKTPFKQGELASIAFQTTALAQIDSIQTQVYTASSKMLADLSLPWNSVSGADGPINTFSNTVNAKLTGAVNKVKIDADTMTTYLEAPWKAGVIAINTWSNSVVSAYDKGIDKAWEYADEASKANSSIKPPSYTTDANPGGSKNLGFADKAKQSVENATDKVKDFMKPTIYSVYGITNDQIIDAGLGPVSLEGFENMLRNYEIGLYVANGKQMVRKASSLEKRNKMLNGRPMAVSGPGAIRKHAKGTLGTKQDEWAYTDEPWLGDEIVLIPGANGNLQYMRKGTAVMPADISANLVEWGKINPDMTALANGVQGVNLMSNYVSKPELNISFDALLKAESITEETLPAVKKLVTQELDNFARKLNYSLRRAGGI